MEAAVEPTLTEVEVERYRQDGFLVVRELFTEDEVSLLRRVLERGRTFQKEIRTGRDYRGNPVEIWISNELRADILAAFVRCRHLVDMTERLLGDEVYHWHHKLTFKSAKRGGAWEWHQDYGYWYDYGCLFPDLISAMIAIDRATLENGCLEVIRGSHRMGRLDTSRQADQTGVSHDERLRVIQEEMDIVPCVLAPGDAVFFHANTLHRSGVNGSEVPRWAFISVFNARHNAPRDIAPARPYDPAAPPTPYSALEKWPRSRIREIALAQLQETDGWEASTGR